MSIKSFTYNPSIPYPLQVGEYQRKQPVIEQGMKRLKERELSGNTFENEYDFLCRYYFDLISHSERKISVQEREMLKSSFAMDAQLEYNWNKYRIIYKFDADFFRLLTEETNSDSVISDMFIYKMPFSCFYVDNKIETNGVKYCGFYVLKRETPGEKEEELFLQFVQPDLRETYAYSTLQLQPGSTKTVGELLGQRKDFYPELDGPHREAFIEMSKQAINVVAYLCTEKPDVIRVKNASTSSNQTGKTPKKKDAVIIGQVGYKLAREIRESKVRYIYEGESNHTGKGKGTPKSAHLRKAHYHSYWTGKRDDPDNRQLIVKLMSPIFVNGHKNEPITTIRKVSKPKK